MGYASLPTKMHRQGTHSGQEPKSFDKYRFSILIYLALFFFICIVISILIKIPLQNATGWAILTLNTEYGGISNKSETQKINTVLILDVTPEMRRDYTTKIGAKLSYKNDTGVPNKISGSKNLSYSSASQEIQVVPKLNISMGEELIQGQAIIGKPVEWTRNIIIQNPLEEVNITIDLPKSAYDILSDLKNLEVSETNEKKVLQASSFKSKLNKTEKFLLYRITYKTPGPIKIEKDGKIERGKWSKEVIIKNTAFVHYHNVTAFTDVPRFPNANYKMFWITDDGKIDVTSDKKFDMEIVDNGDSNRIMWTVPSLSEQRFEIIAEFMSLRVWPGQYGRTWTVYFNISGSGNLTIENLTKGIKFSKLYYYYSNNWVEASPSVNGSRVQIYWNGDTYPKGKIVYDILELGRYRLKFTFGNLTAYVQNFDYYTQVSSLLDLDHPQIDYKVCSYTLSFWPCDPQYHENGPGYSDDTYDPGYYGETYTGNITRYFNIPKNSTVTNFSIQVETLINEPLITYPYSDKFSPDGKVRKAISIGELYPDEKEEVIVLSDYSFVVWNSSGEEKTFYNSDYLIYDVDVGDISILSPDEEIAIATENGLVVLAHNTSYIWNITGKEYTKISVGDLMTEYELFSQDDSHAEDFRILTTNTTANFTLPWGVNDSERICYVDTALNYRGNKSNELKLRIANETYDIDRQKITRTNSLRYSADDSKPEDYQCIGCSNSSKVNFTLWFSFSEPIPAKSCYLETALNYKGNKSGNLSLIVGNESYDVDKNDIFQGNEIEYKSDDNSIENNDCIGCDNGNNIPYFNLDALNFPQPIPANTCYLKVPMCYNGEKVDDLWVKGLGVGVHKIDIDQITTPCNDTADWDWVYIKLNCSSISNKWIYLECQDCNDTSNYEIMADNSTSGNSYYQSDTSYIPPYDYVVRIYSNESLLYSIVKTNVNCSLLTQGANIRAVMKPTTITYCWIPATPDIHTSIMEQHGTQRHMTP